MKYSLGIFLPQEYNQICLQTLANIPGEGAKSPLAENHWSGENSEWPRWLCHLEPQLRLSMKHCHGFSCGLWRYSPKRSAKTFGIKFWHRGKRSFISQNDYLEGSRLLQLYQFWNFVLNQAWFTTALSCSQSSCIFHPRRSQNGKRKV